MTDTDQAPDTPLKPLCVCRGLKHGDHRPGCSFAATPAPRCARCGLRGKTTSGRCPFCGSERDGSG